MTRESANFWWSWVSGVAEQQIQRYESTGYGAASLARSCDIADALGTEVREVVSLNPDAA